MSLWRRALLVFAQTVAGLVGGVASVLIVGNLDVLLAPPITEPVLCEYFCFDTAASGWILLIGVPLSVAGAVWLTGQVVGQRGNIWLTLLGTLIGFGVAITSQIWQLWLPLPIVLDIVLPILFCPFIAALFYQLSARDKKTQEVIEVTHE